MSLQQSFFDIEALHSFCYLSTFTENIPIGWNRPSTSPPMPPRAVAACRKRKTVFTSLPAMHYSAKAVARLYQERRGIGIGFRGTAYRDGCRAAALANRGKTF